MLGRVASEAEVHERMKNLGETFSRSDEASFKAFEQKYLAAYEKIFESMAKVAVVIESGTDGEPELSMSKWMEPSRGIGVVVAKKTALKPALLAAARDALGQMDERFVIAIDDYPTQVYVFPEDPILIGQGSLEEDLRALGL